MEDQACAKSDDAHAYGQFERRFGRRREASGFLRRKLDFAVA